MLRILLDALHVAMFHEVPSRTDLQRQQPRWQEPKARPQSGRKA